MEGMIGQGSADAAFAALLTPAQAAAPVQTTVTPSPEAVAPVAEVQDEGLPGLPPEGVDGEPLQPDPEGDVNEATLNLSAYQRNKERAQQAEQRAQQAEQQAAAMEARLAELEKVRTEASQREAEAQQQATAQEWAQQKREYVARAAETVRELNDEGRYDEAQAYMAEAMEIVAEAEAKRAQQGLREQHEAELARAKAEDVARRHAAYQAQHPTLTKDLGALDAFGPLLNLEAVKNGTVELSALHELAKALRAAQGASAQGIAQQVQQGAADLTARTLASQVQRRGVNGVGSIPAASSEYRSAPTRLTKEQWLAQNPNHPQGAGDGWFKYLTGA